ncbi:MAG: aminotransferase class V-fold PLP-dependent enzyme [Candidatus Methylacidiphilales bacterium]|nr:aminotransferase class V-fold PLP-dependent enzyme [Candidatus Methylacidiphilales bacterium]
MSLSIADLARDESLRRTHFPVTAHRTFLSHAAVSPLPACATQALDWFGQQASEDQQEGPAVFHRVLGTRVVAAQLLGCQAQEIALLGPTAMGLNLVADGLDWQPGDEVVYYRDDYPANVYPWTKLAARGVRPVSVRPERPGEITWEVVEASLTPRTRLVALASAHFLTGFRIDVDTIGRRLHERGILFCLDAIQTLGAFPLSVEHVDFLSADSHKWMLGPLGAGIFYVRESLFDRLRPTHLGSWNVWSPNFIAQEDLNRFYEGGRRYECGSLNLPGILGMRAPLEMILALGVGAIAARIRELRNHTLLRLGAADWHPVWGPDLPEAHVSGIITFPLDGRNPEALVAKLAAARVSVAVRHNREGAPHLRVAPHFYSTEAEIDRLAEVLESS